MQNGEVVTTSKIQQTDDEEWEPKFISVQVTAELSVPVDFCGFDEAMDNFRPGDLQKDLVGEFIKVKSGVYENAACGHITSVVVVGADGGEAGQPVPALVHIEGNDTVEAAFNEVFKWALGTDVVQECARAFPDQEFRMDATVALYKLDEPEPLRIRHPGYFLRSPKPDATDHNHEAGQVAPALT